MTVDPEELLLGPRGRRLCLELAMESDTQIQACVYWLGHSLDPGAGRSRVLITGTAGDAGESLPIPSPGDLVGALATLDLRHTGVRAVEKALARAVDTARYWQEPDGEDVLASLPEVVEALQPVAHYVAGMEATLWWMEPRQVEQWAIDWRSEEDPAPLPREPRQALSKWSRETRADEVGAARERPADPHASWSGNWWVVPHGTIRSVGRIPLGLDLVEDSFGWEHATVIPVRGVGRTYEVLTEADWVFLCREYPLEVTASRRHDWFRTTGRAGRWVIPDWERVAEHWDAVHLTVLAYLSGAGRALEVDANTSTVLAGWDPDVTLWLTDVARESEPPRQQWARITDQEEWVCEPMSLE
ncbi:hypothetical protein DXT87_07545 [Arthrobacter sp. AET 35A]|nr:hypothetical protein [Arthrobacter sp. AET 35A]